MTLSEGQEMTLTFNTHIPSLTQLVVDASTKFRWKNDPAKVKKNIFGRKSGPAKTMFGQNSGPTMAGLAVPPPTALTIQNILMTCLVLGERRCPLGYLFINLCASCKCEHDGKSSAVLK